MSELVGKQLGQYEITDVIGQGGMAVVYKARQASMDRDVAIKVIKGDMPDSPDFVTRFEHEARLIAKLQHAHILPVIDFGREGNLNYLVMRMVDGGSLDVMLKQGALSPQKAARMFSQIATALTYAHNEGIVHRDLKPNNILLDKNGIPYLSDFGIAKMLQQSVALTATGMVMGTPSYMAPEQWRGQNVDARTDIYALGVMLYEMLTGQLPFVGDTPYILMYKHFDEMPPTPSKVVEGLPEGVNYVINRAMAKDPQDRFASAEQMAEELNTVLNGTASSVKAKVDQDFIGTVMGEAPTGTKPAQPSATAPTPTQGLPGAVESASSKRVSRLPLWIGLVPLLIMILAIVLVVINNRPSYRELIKLEGHTEWLMSIAWTKDGSTLVTSSGDRSIRVWNPNVQEAVKTVRETANIADARLSPDNVTVASVGEDGSVKLWDINRGELIGPVELPKNTGFNKPQRVAWSPDGTRLSVGNLDGSIYIVDVKEQTVLHTLQAPQFMMAPLAWSPDGKVFATQGDDNTIALWDIAKGTLIDTYAAHSDVIHHLSWSRDGSRLASASQDGTIRTWDMTTGQALPLLTIKASPGIGISWVEWSPDGKKLASSAGFINLGGIDDKSVKVWNAETGELLAKLEAHIQPVRAVVWSPDGSKLATAGLDYVVRVWSVG